MVEMSKKHKALVKEACKNADIAGELHFEIKEREAKLKPIKKAIIESAIETRQLKLEGDRYKAIVSVVPGSVYESETVWEYLREEVKLSEKEAIKYFSVKVTDFKDAMGDTAAVTLSEPGKTMKKCLLKKLK